MTLTNDYIRYYLDQQQGKGIPVFRGSQWQAGYGLGGLFKSLARSIIPMVKSSARSLGKIALDSGANFAGDVLAGKNVKKAAKARLAEAKSIAKKQAVSKLQSLTQTGNGSTRKKRLKKRSSQTVSVINAQIKKQLEKDRSKTFLVEYGDVTS